MTLSRQYELETMRAHFLYYSVVNVVQQYIT